MADSARLFIRYAFYARCYSSVVEHVIGNDGVGSSILLSSTTRHTDGRPPLKPQSIDINSFNEIFLAILAANFPVFLTLF